MNLAVIKKDMNFPLGEMNFAPTPPAEKCTYYSHLVVFAVQRLELEHVQNFCYTVNMPHFHLFIKVTQQKKLWAERLRSTYCFVRTT